MNEEKKSGMSPIVKGGLACCAILAIFTIIGCGGFMWWGQRMASIDGPTTASRFQDTVGAGLPDDVEPKFSVDMSPFMPMTIAFAGTSDPIELTLIAIRIPQGQQQPNMAEHMLLWNTVIGPFGPQFQQLGVQLSTAEAQKIQDTGDAVEGELKVGEKTFKTFTIPCKHADGTELKRIYVPLAGASGVFAIGGAEDFEQEDFEEFLKNCTPR